MPYQPAKKARNTDYVFILEHNGMSLCIQL